MEPNIGINDSHRKDIADGLTKLLADTYTLYLKTQNFHWNVTGPNFHSFHAMFEEQYTALAATVDEIAERIRAIGHVAPGSFQQFRQLTQLDEETGVPKANDMVRQLAEDNEAIARLARDLRDKVEEAADESTLDLLAARMAYHEKTSWMLRATLG